MLTGRYDISHKKGSLKRLGLLAEGRNSLSEEELPGDPALALAPLAVPLLEGTKGEKIAVGALLNGQGRELPQVLIRERDADGMCQPGQPECSQENREDRIPVSHQSLYSVALKAFQHDLAD